MERNQQKSSRSPGPAHYNTVDVNYSIITKGKLSNDSNHMSHRWSTAPRQQPIISRQEQAFIEQKHIKKVRL